MVWIQEQQHGVIKQMRLQTNGKAGKWERQLRHGSSNRAKAQESCAFQLHHVRDLELKQLFVQC